MRHVASVNPMKMNETKCSRTVQTAEHSGPIPPKANFSYTDTAQHADTIDA
jgi:hypothetical protein